MCLVAYESDSSSDQDGDRGPQAASTSSARQRHVTNVGTGQKRKALPSLPDFYTSRDQRDDPALHQGRKRTRPFVDGDYDTHVYISLSVSPRVHAALNKIIERARELCPGYNLVSLLDPSTQSDVQDPQVAKGITPRDFHISLTHPVPLRRSQIEPFAADLTQSLSTFSKVPKPSLQISFAGAVKVYYNGVKTGGQGTGGRAFLAFQIGAGHSEIDAMVEHAIHPLLQKLHLPLYHSNPEYHASFAWCLLDPQVATEALPRELADLGAGQDGRVPTSTPFPDSVVKQLDDELRDVFLESQPDGGWNVIELKLKVGKEIRSIRL